MTALTDAELASITDEVGDRLGDPAALQATFDRLNDAAGGTVPWQAVAYTVLVRFRANRITSPASFKADDYSEGWQTKEQLGQLNARIDALYDQAIGAGWTPEDVAESVGWLERVDSGWRR